MPEAGSEGWRRSDLLLIGAMLLVLVASGLGFRDPWPADEPRFAALARDMFHGSDWLFPRVGGDLYQDKPPLYFWLLAAAYGLLGSVRASFLVPSLLATGGVLLLVYDLGRRLAGNRAGLNAALTLACTVQFLTTARSAQIDATLCLLMTLSLYGLLRHVLWGPAWRWYFVGGFMAGLGVITKGVGFLPILVLPLYALLRARGWQQLPRFTGGWRWSIAPLGLLLGIFTWFVPMLVAVATRDSPEFTAYRDEILFQQTVTRYSGAWHHHQPFYYFLVNVIPLLWLPLSLLFIWLVPRWRDAWRARDARIALLLGWVIVLLLFFSASPGKRSIYMNPALPALSLAAAPYLEALFARRGVRRAALVLGCLPLFGAAVFAVASLVGAKFAVKALQDANLSGAWPLWGFLALGLIGAVIAWRRQPVAIWLAVIAALAVTWGFAIAPAMNPERSGGAFTRAMLAKVRPGEELGLVAYKEQFLLYLDRPTVNFGHRRWLEGDAEAHDAAAWLAASPDRVLMVPHEALERCFGNAQRTSLGRSASDEWDLVRGMPEASCAARGDASRAITYVPGGLSADHASGR